MNEYFDDFEKDKYWLWLSYIKEMWGGKARKILAEIGTPENLYLLSEDEMKKMGIFSERDIYNIMAAKDVNPEQIYDLLLRKNIKFTYCGHSNYPERLMKYEDRPVWLFYKGELPDEKKKIAGMVGARNCSRYGYGKALEISRDLSLRGVNIISGMARGIDAAAHKGSLETGGKTFAVLGCGVDICYPRDNIELYMNIIENGCVMSEFAPGTPPLSWQFPERNRIISMFSDALAIIEAKKNSGSLITTDYALQYGKEIFALPGRADDVMSEGCNEIIKAGASLLTEARDMLYSMGIVEHKEDDSNKNKCKIVLEKENEVVYSCLGLLPQDIETIVNKTGKTSVEVFSILADLIIRDLVVEPVKNHYAKK